MGTYTNRTRSRDNRLPGTLRVIDYNPGGSVGSDTYTPNIGRMASGNYKSISDIKSSRQEYANARKNGGVLNHPMQLTNDNRSSAPSNWFFGYHSVWGSRRIQGDIACQYHQGNPTPEWSKYLEYINEDFDRVLIEAYGKVNSPDALAKVIWSEREKTVRFVGGAVERAAFVLEGRIPDLEKRLKLALPGKGPISAFRSWWLGVRFGVRPMIGDIMDTAKAAAHKKPYTGKLLIARGGTERAYKGGYSDTFAGPGGTTVSRVGFWSEKTKTSAGVFYMLKDSSEAAWKAHCLGLSADSTPRNVWEEMPYSWAVDYFYGVGKWIDAATPNPFMLVIDDWVTQTRKQDNKTVLPSVSLTVNTPPVTTYTSGGGSYQELIDTVVRRTGQGVPPHPVTSGKPLSFVQAVDLAAVALQHFDRTVKRIESLVRI